MNCATPLLSWGKNILEQSDPNGEEILKLDEAKSQIRNPKLQIGPVQSEISKFRI